MKRFRTLTATPVVLVLALCASAVEESSAQQNTRRFRPPAQASAMIALTGATLIDGRGGAPVLDAVVLVQGARITAVGARERVPVPPQAQVIDAHGKWIVPGLIDGHVHFFQTGGLDARADFMTDPRGRAYRDIVEEIRQHPAPYFAAYLCSGVTAVVDPGGPMWSFDLRDTHRTDARAPHVAVSGPLLATYDPPDLEVGNDDPIWMMKGPEQIRGLVDRIAARRPDMIKIWFVTRQGDDLAAQTTLVKSAIGAIHEKGLRAAVHATSLRTANAALEGGADILVHSVGDADVDAEFLALARQRNVIYVPTLIVGEGYRAVRLKQRPVTEYERACAPPASVASLDSLPSLPDSLFKRPAPTVPSQVPTEQRNLKRVMEAGVTVAAGTDAGNTGTLHGPSLHREFELMGEAGLTPAQILTTATRNGARLMGRERDLGTIEPGKRADLVILTADPLADIRHTREIDAVMKDGVFVKGAGTAAATRKRPRAVGGRREAIGSQHKTAGSRQKAVGGRQQAEPSRQKAADGRR